MSRYYLFHEVISDVNELPSGFARKVSKYVLSFTDFTKAIEKLNPDVDILTFDDAGWSQEEAIRLANSKGFRTILFVPTSFIDKEGFMSKQSIIDIASNTLNIIGCHGHSHIMSFMTGERWKKEINNLRDAKNEYGFVNFDYLALPGGTLNMDFIKAYKDNISEKPRVFHSGNSNMLVQFLNDEILWMSRCQVLDSNVKKRGSSYFVREIKTILKQLYYGKIIKYSKRQF